MTRRKSIVHSGLPAAYDKALTLLARREHSQRELLIRLQRGGYDDDEISAALARLSADGYQSERRFAEMLLRARVAHGYGPQRIHAELRSHAVEPALIGAVMGASATDWLALARTQWRRRYGKAPAADFKERARRAQFLLRRGFDAATVRAVTRADSGADDAIAD